MQGVSLIKYTPKHTDERGSTLSYIADQKLKEILMINRKKGSTSGNHYHEGKDPTRNPEIQYLISGKVKLTVKNIKTNEKESHILTENTEIRIDPMIAHKIEMLEDSILLEFHTEESPYEDMIKMEI